MPSVRVPQTTFDPFQVRGPAFDQRLQGAGIAVINRAENALQPFRHRVARQIEGRFARRAEHPDDEPQNLTTHMPKRLLKGAGMKLVQLAAALAVSPSAAVYHAVLGKQLEGWAKAAGAAVPKGTKLPENLVTVDVPAALSNHRVYFLASLDEALT